MPFLLPRNSETRQTLVKVLVTVGFGELPQKSASGRHGVVRPGAPPGASEGGNAAASPGAATGHLGDPAERADRAAHAGTAAVGEYGASRADAPGTHQVGRRLWRFWNFAWLIVNCFFGVELVSFLLNKWCFFFFFIFFP